MNPYRAYQQQGYSNWLRIDLLLAMYDGAIERLEAAVAALKAHDRAAAQPALDRARLIVAGMVSAVDAARGDIASQFLRLYEFVLYSIGQGKIKNLDAALSVLRTLREALQAIRPQAAEMERTGQIPTADDLPKVQMTV